MTATKAPALVRRLRQFTGPVHFPGDPGYDAARLPWQRGVEHRPAAVAEAACVDDVRVAIRAAREARVPFAVMATGHGCVQALTDGLLLRTGGLTGVGVDQGTHTIRVGAGETWTAVLDGTEPHALTPGCGTTGSVGVTGYTVQGGIGWLSREYGTAADDLQSAEVVTADGRIVTASAQEHADLWWALRGGGGGFGIVTAMTLRVHPVHHVVGGVAMFAIDRARQLLETYRSWAPHEPDAMSTAVQLIRLPDRADVPAALRGRAVAAVRAFSTLGEDRTRAQLAPLLAAGGRPLVDGIVSGTLAALLRRQGQPPPVACTERVHLCDRLSDGLLDQLVGAVGPDSDQVAAFVEVKQWGGAIAAGAGSGPDGHRDAAFSVLVAARFDGRQPDAEVTASIAALTERLTPHTTGGSLLSLLPDPALTATAFTAGDRLRLTDIKDRWDPDDVFGSGHTFTPSRSRKNER